MSYILEALKKAEAERRGEVSPAVRAPLVASMPARRPAWRAPWPWMAASGVLVAVAAALWLVPKKDSPPSVQVAVAPSRPALVIPPQEAAQPSVQEEPAPAPSKPKDKVAKKPAEKPAEKKPPKQPVKQESAQARKQADKQGETADAKKATQPEVSIATLRELPEQIQREIPPLSIGGYLYSGNKADRTVLINKRLLHEGDEVAPGLVLESMQPNGMVFNYRGYRYRTGYRNGS